MLVGDKRMKCFHCGKEIEHELDMVLLNIDGDFACDQVCADAYEKDKEHFLNVTIHDDRLYNEWLGVTLDAT